MNQKDPEIQQAIQELREKTTVCQSQIMALSEQSASMKNRIDIIVDSKNQLREFPDDAETYISCGRMWVWSIFPTFFEGFYWKAKGMPSGHSKRKEK